MKYLSIVILLASFTSMAQQSNTATDIDQQFDQLMESSNNFKEYKVVKASALKTLQSQTKEQIQELNSEIDALQANISAEKEEQARLQTALTDANNNVENLNQQRDSISLLGMPVDKSTYNAIVWSIVGILVVVVLILFLRYKKSMVTTTHAKEELQVVESELEELRRKSIEKEQRLGRQLQDERNKLSRMKQDQSY
jgi:chromosome segregation ATPase